MPRNSDGKSGRSEQNTADERNRMWPRSYSGTKWYPESHLLTLSPVIFPKVLSCDKFQFQFQGGIWGQEGLTLCRRLAREAAADQVYSVVRNWTPGLEQVAPLSQEQFHWDGG